MGTIDMTGVMSPIYAIFTAVVMVSGLFLASGFTIDAFAAPSEKGQEKGQAKGCENGTAKNNKHCDNGPPCTDQSWWQDNDGDGFGNGDRVISCGPPDDVNPWVNQNGDCDDSDPNVYPGNGC